MNSITIRKWTEADPIPEITSLLHRAYLELADMSFRYHATWQDDETTLQRLKSGIGFVAEKEGKIIGTATLYLPTGDTDCDWYNKPDVARFGQFAVEPTLQRNGIGSAFLETLASTALEHGFNNLALDTAEGAQHLIDMYKAKGFEFVCYADWDVTNYRSVIMNKQLTD